jgi:hypothetical protein
VNISLSSVVPSTELLDEKVVPMGQCRNAGQPDGVPIVLAYADDEDEENEEDMDDLDEDEDEEDDEILDDDGLDYDWEEVVDDDDEEEDDDDEEDEEEDEENDKE